MALVAVRAHRGPFSRADLARTPDDGRRHEIIDGVPIVSAAPGRLHQRVVVRLRDLTTPVQFPVTVVPADLTR